MQIKAINTKKWLIYFLGYVFWHLKSADCTLVLWILITGQKWRRADISQCEWKSFIIHSVHELPAPVNRLVSHLLSHAKRGGIKWFCPPQRPELRLKLTVQLFPARLAWQVYCALQSIDCLRLNSWGISETHVIIAHFHLNLMIFISIRNAEKLACSFISLPFDWGFYFWI